MVSYTLQVDLASGLGFEEACYAQVFNCNPSQIFLAFGHYN